MRHGHLSTAAAQLMDSLVERSGLDRNRISIGRFQSVDWQSLTFTGERHEISLRLAGPDAAPALALLRYGLAEAEWRLVEHVVADILIVSETTAGDGSITVAIEALTLSE